MEDEVQKAFAEERDRKELVLFPVRIWARKLRDQRNVGDFRRWKDHDAYERSFAADAWPRRDAGATLGAGTMAHRHPANTG